jgi:threonine dehydratase
MFANLLPIVPEQVVAASTRISPYIHDTPLLSSAFLNERLGHEVLFKAESFQKSGAFKIRGALNALLALRERGELPKKLVAFSSGNHAQAVAKAAKMLDISATVIMPKFVSQVKQQATLSYGAELILTETRNQTEELAYKMQSEGWFLLHPSDNDEVITGQGTACHEALLSGANPDAIFATCGGGGWLAGTWLAAQLSAEKPQVFGAEPKIANDAARSLREGKIFGFEQTPMTIADGARTLHISARSFYYLQKLSGFYEVEEREIIYWTQWLQHLLKVTVEPTSAVAMAAAIAWLQKQNGKKRVLIMLSGGNIDASSQRQIWQENFLEQVPSL